MKYLMMIKHAEAYRNEQIPQGLLEAMGPFVERYMKSGKIVDTQGLTPTSKGKRVVLQGGKMSVVDGPFAESKEIVGGYAVMDLASDAEALEITKEFLELHRVHWPEFNCECELRPVEQ